MSFWGELRRRNVVKVAVAYAIVGWLLLQITSTVFPAFQMPEWTIVSVTLLLVLGFPIALLDIAYGYGRIGDSDDARRLFDEISAVASQDQDIGAGGWALAHLAVRDVDDAMVWLERGADKASRHESDTGYYSLMNIRMNFTNDPVPEQPEFIDVRDRLRGE